MKFLSAATVGLLALAVSSDAWAQGKSGSNPNAGGGNPNAGGGNPNAGGGNPNAGGGNPNAGGGNPNASGTVPITNPILGANNSFVLSWSNVCHTTGVTFPTCASAQLRGWDNGWMSLDFWARAGAGATYETASVTAIGIGGTPGATGNRGTGWDAGFDGLQIDWSRFSGGGGIPGPATADGFRTTGQSSAFCSGIDSNGSAAPNCPGGYTTLWNGFGNGGGAIFYWFVGNSAIAALDLAEVSLEMHVQAGPNGQSTGYACLSDDYLNLGCGGDDPDPPLETTVPEPATMTLLATGLAGLAAARRRRNNKV